MPGLEDAHVVAALERLRVRAALETHAALRLRERGTTINLGTFVPATAVRRAVIGLENSGLN